MTGCLRSPSIISVDFPKSFASTYPRLRTVDDFPSPFTALVTTMTVLVRPPPSSAKRVAATLNCSATTYVGFHLLTRFPSGAIALGEVLHLEIAWFGFDNPPDADTPPLLARLSSKSRVSAGPFETEGLSRRPFADLSYA